MTLPVDVVPAYEDSKQLLLVPLSATNADGKAHILDVRDGNTSLLKVDAAAGTASLTVPLTGTGSVSGINGGVGCIEVPFFAEDLTDGEAAVGTFDLSATVPVGAVILRCQVNVTVAFIGDVSATLIVGDGTDHDRFNTGTPSVFTTGHKDMGVPSGTAFVSTAITPRLTVTSAADITPVIAGGGAGFVRITYWQPAAAA